MLVDVAATNMVPYLSKCIVDTLSINLAHSVLIILLLMGFFWTLEKTLSHVQEIVFFPVINLSIRDITFKVINHIHHLPLVEYQKLSIPEVINCIRRISMSARAFIKILFLMIIPTIIKLTIATGVALKLGIYGGLLGVAFILALFILYKGTKWYVRARDSAWEASDAVTLRIHDSLLNTKSTRFFPTLEQQDVFALLKTEAIKWYYANTKLHSIYILIGLLLGATVTGILYCTILGIQNHTLTLGDFVMLKAQLIAAFIPLKALSLEFRQLAEATIDVKKILTILSIPAQPTPRSLPQDAVYNKESLDHRALSLQQISFSYPDQKTLFEEISCSIAAGEKIALTGPSGCGKSTLLKLMAGLIPPQTGTIYVNGKNNALFSMEQLGQAMHFIPQDFKLFNASFHYNLTYGSPPVSLLELNTVVKKVGLTELIQNMPNGYHTLLGEMGTRLSGGEKQRVAIARALLLKPKILFLDETTHSLPEESVQQILQAIFQAIPTVVIVSHHAATLNQVNRVLSLPLGKITTHSVFSSSDSKLTPADY